MGITRRTLRAFVIAFALIATSHVFAADGGVWSVSKSSGEVWISNGDVQQASLRPDDNLKPGDTIRTGRNGRVLLVRGEESILVAPNSVVGLPTEAKEGLATTIVQKAGSILLEVEKRNVKHFEVETPYLAAVVKGTKFSVSVGASSTSVDVVRGQVEVTDFKSGQIAQVMAGQKATALEHGKPGLSLSGSGTFNPIEQGKPRPSSVDRVPVPKGGFPAMRNAANGKTIHGHAYGQLRISSALGETKVDYRKVTHGLARGSNGINSASRNLANNNTSNTVWSSSSTTSAGAAASATTAASNASSSSSSAATTVAATIIGSSNSSGNGANGNGNNGNGNGNGGVGNGNGKGNLKH